MMGTHTGSRHMVGIGLYSDWLLRSVDWLAYSVSGGWVGDSYLHSVVR